MIFLRAYHFLENTTEVCFFTHTTDFFISEQQTTMPQTKLTDMDKCADVGLFRAFARRPEGRDFPGCACTHEDIRGMLLSNITRMWPKDEPVPLKREDIDAYLIEHHADYCTAPDTTGPSPKRQRVAAPEPAPPEPAPALVGVVRRLQARCKNKQSKNNCDRENCARHHLVPLADVVKHVRDSHEHGEHFHWYEHFNPDDRVCLCFDFDMDHGKELAKKNGGRGGM